MAIILKLLSKNQNSLLSPPNGIFYRNLVYDSALTQVQKKMSKDEGSRDTSTLGIQRYKSRIYSMPRDGLKASQEEEQ